MLLGGVWHGQTVKFTLWGHPDGLADGEGFGGFAKGSANVQLSPATVNGTDGTEMTYEVNAAVGGKLAQIGSRLVNGAAKKMAAEFFTNFVRVVCDDTEGKLEVNLQTLSSDG